MSDIKLFRIGTAEIESFLAALEAQTRRGLRPLKCGPKPLTIEQDSRRFKPPISRIGIMPP
jgi:hypothetical protein